MSSDDAVVITGLGAVAPNGVGIPAFTRSLRAGRSGLVKLPFAHEHVHTPAVAAVADAEFDVTQVMPAGDCRRLPRLVPMALAAAREALAMAGLGPFAVAAPGGNGDTGGATDKRSLRSLSVSATGIDTGEDTDKDRRRSLSVAPTPPDQLALSRRTGLILGTGGGGIDFTIEQFLAYSRGKSPSLWTITNATHGNLAGELSIRLGLRGPSHCVSTGCTSSSDAFGTALLHLQANRADAMVVGGADAHLVPGTLWPMELLGVLSTGKWDPPCAASRPFDKRRDGFILGEGAWFAVLERAEPARRRGATALAELAGYGCTCDAYHRVRPDPDPVEAARAIALALEQARLAPGDVQYLHYHGTSTPLNDATETRAIRLAFGPHAEKLAGSSVKSMIGHPQGACGAAALVATVAALRGMDAADGAARPFLPPTINLDTPDPECDLDYVPNSARPTDAKVAVVNCLAFGAKNSALVVRIV